MAWEEDQVRMFIAKQIGGGKWPKVQLLVKNRKAIAHLSFVLPSLVPYLKQAKQRLVRPTNALRGSLQITYRSNRKKRDRSYNRKVAILSIQTNKILALAKSLR